MRRDLNKVSGGNRSESGDMSLRFGDFSSNSIDIGDYTKREAKYTTKTSIKDY